MRLRRWIRNLAVGVAAVALAGCVRYNPPLGNQAIDVMGPPSMSANHLVQWYYVNQRNNCYRATVPLQELAETFIQEGVHEGVRGDIAFYQSILETGWFCWPGGSVRPEYNNFAGLGATDSNPNANRFPTARAGIRAQMQHLRAYATVDGPCGDPCWDVRFHLVRRGTGVHWNQFGNGVWASSTNDYGGRIIRLFESGLVWRDGHPE
jgi:hypothetical protein